MQKNNKTTKKLLFIGKTLFASAFVIGYILEKKRPERNYPANITHDLLNLSAGITNKAVMSLINGITNPVFAYAERKNQSSQSFGLLNSLQLTEKQKLLSSLILIDLWMYLWHRMNHRFSFLWQFHKFHHEDLMVNTTSVARFHPTEIIISNALRLIIFIPLGITKRHISIYEKFFFSVIYFHHSNIKLSDKYDLIYRKIAVSPEMHRTHHSKDINEANSNYGSVLPYWDMIFGTYIKFPDKKVEFGLADNV